ncbi:hypothetical protein [Methylobacterium sp. WSM2598]|uniref:hypothetical protein n=1 Tax=Methylobacterium sp. WSM2598 TaxID=398261 RepID=UPI0003726EFE|nr:hypothetical protein [Methylobacterium sp. WSM2598]
MAATELQRRAAIRRLAARASLPDLGEAHVARGTKISVFKAELLDRLLLAEQEARRPAGAVPADFEEAR